MTAFEQIKDSLEMTALVRSAVTDNTEEVSLKHDLTMEEYTLFKKMYVNDPYSTIGHMNAFMGRMRNNYNVMDHHVDAALELECLVEEENLFDNIAENEEIKSGIPGFVSQGYTAMWNDGRDKGRQGEKVAVNKRGIKRTLKIAKLFAIGNRNDDRQTIDDITKFLHSTLKYDREFAESIAKMNGDNSVMISKYEIEGKAICRQHALYMQIALQEAGIPARQVYGLLKGATGEGPHMWDFTAADNKAVLIDIAGRGVPLYRETLEIGYAYLASRGEHYITAPRSEHYYKYSTRGLQ